MGLIRLEINMNGVRTIGTLLHLFWYLSGTGVVCSVTRKKSPNVYKSCPKIISLEKMIYFDTFTKIA